MRVYFVVSKIKILFKSGFWKNLLANPHHLVSFWKRNNNQMNVILRWLLSSLGKAGLIERLRGAATLNSLGDICEVWF